MDSKNLEVLHVSKQENKIKHTISEITESIAGLKKLLNSDDVILFSAYKSRNTELKTLPPKVTISFPRFTPLKINRKQLYQLFGSLLDFSFKIEEHGNKMDSPGAESFSLGKPFIDVPRIVTEINTKCRELNSVSCLSDDEMWTCSNDNIMRLYNCRVELVKSVQTKSRKVPWGIAVTINGDLIYTDRDDRTVNIVKNTEIQTVIRVQGWKPYRVCSTSSGDLLTIINSDDYNYN